MPSDAAHVFAAGRAMAYGTALAFVAGDARLCTPLGGAKANGDAMRRLLVLCFVVGALAGCHGDASSMAPTPDLEPAPGTFGAACTVVSNTSTECNSHVCTNTFDAYNHPVCSQQCTAGTADPTCPNGSQGMHCNMQGYCKP